ncbi:MAG: YbjN domain-containing protein [Candidatus Kapabacteria bacterium]|nr:YbjN domain-containing protein [Candidatus Kapabacteria bacterium]
MDKPGETPQELIDTVRSRVDHILRDVYPEYISFDNGAFAITRGSTQVMIVVRPFTEEDCVVECIAQVVQGATITPELMKFLLRKNAELHLGGFGLLFDDTVVFTHALTGTNMDRNELIAAVASTAIISDYYDDEIVAMAGGKRASDILEL